MSTIGARLKDERKRLGLKQEDFAVVAGVTRRPYAEWESGNTSPTAVQLAAMAAAGADVRYIVTGERDGTPPETLTGDERELLALFRRASLSVKAAAIGALQGGMTSGSSKVVIHGRVGQQVEKIEGGVKIDMGSKK